MHRPWTEEIVHVQTEDEIIHAGGKFAPTGNDVKTTSVLMMHGIGGAFSNPAYVAIGRHLAAHGYTFISTDNRGHHFGYKAGETASGQARLEGAGWELFSEAPLDIAAWVDYAASLGFTRVVLFGHSYGAYKSVFYQGERHDPRIVGMILGSPPRGVARLAHPQLAMLAESLVQQGKGRDLLPWDIIQWSAGTVSAQTYLDAYHLNIDFFGFETSEPLVSQVRCPILAFYGTEESHVGTEEDLQTIKRHASASPRVDTALVQGADHDWLGREEAIAALAASWLDALPSGD